MLPSDCSSQGIVYAGAIMKLMDNVAGEHFDTGCVLIRETGIVAARHCRTNVVTASLVSRFLS